MGCDNHRHLRGQPYGLAQRCFTRIIGRFQVEGRERRRSGAQYVHRMCILDSTDDVEHRRRQFPRGLEFGVKTRELLLVRQFAIQKQPCSFLKARMFSKVVDRIAAIAQLAGLAINEGTGRAIKVDTFEAALNLDRLGCFSH